MTPWSCWSTNHSAAGRAPTAAALSLVPLYFCQKTPHQKPTAGKANDMRSFFIVVSLLFAVETGAGIAGEMPKRGGTLTYIHPGGGATQSRRASRRDVRDRSFGSALLQCSDARRSPELVRHHTVRLRSLHRDPDHTPDDGKTYTFKIREGVEVTG